ncbi:MAG: hypothetical protein F6J90_11550 [Moorea sp. SIOASIH]|uniref:hypothetical protein n=1 Tax=Moorena sp. SIOASIH TaxID=2607817 RepID=UPI0013BA0FAD|nr:hypothetical protein [Moorena sp. SIOASIH]NEO36909.1 hypothetical protein [Moorena sp. SIOASIH]
MTCCSELFALMFQDETIDFYYPYSLLPTPYSLLPTPYSLKPRTNYFTPLTGILK